MSESLAEQKARRAASAFKELFVDGKLVAQIADGEDLDPDFVDHVLTDNQKTIDDLRRAAELLLHRRELRETWDKAATMAKDRDGIEE